MFAELLVALPIPTVASLMCPAWTGVELHRDSFHSEMATLVSPCQTSIGSLTAEVLFSQNRTHREDDGRSCGKLATAFCAAESFPRRCENVGNPFWGFSTFSWRRQL
jgi:hypothetical protein